MNAPAHSAGLSDAANSPEGTVSRIFVICNKKGLHARASAKFVQTVEKFDAEVRVCDATRASVERRSWD